MPLDHEAAGTSRGRPATVGEIVSVRARPTVVRLDDLDRPGGDWIETAYHVTGEVRNHLDALGAAFGRDHGTGVFLIGPYGSGKSHFLAYLTRRLAAGTFHTPPPTVVRLSLLNFPGHTPLERTVTTAIGLPPGGDDRRVVWADAMERHQDGLVLVIDELSEFLRSKPDARSFNEDVRFLQFLGEWAQGARLWIVAAMQEQLEHTGELEHGLYRKIKDRFPVRLLLTAAHLRDLVQDGLLEKRPGYDRAVERIVAELREALPWNPENDTLLRAIYPVHPAALDLLEEIRDRFSQTRGAVDFVVARVAGDPTRNIPSLLDQPLGTFLGPEAIVDHFGDQLDTQSEFQPLSRQVLPWFRERKSALFEAKAAQDLAERVLKLLVLVHLSPTRKALSARDATAWLLYRPSRLDAERNVAIVKKVLDTFVDHGRFVARVDGGYAIALDDDGGAGLERRLRARAKELEARGEEIFRELTPILRGDRFDPWSFPADAWSPRNVRWHFHDRRLSIWFGNDDPPRQEGLGLVVRSPFGTAAPHPTHPTILPARIELGPALVELAAQVEIAREDRGGEAATRLAPRIHSQVEALRARVRQAYSEARYLERGTEPLPMPRLSAASTFESMIDAAAETVLRRAFPTFDRYAPSHGPLPNETLRAVLRHLAERELDDATAEPPVQLVREAYLVPMGLLQRRGSAYALTPNLEKNDLVRLFLPLIEQQPAPKTLYEHFGGPGQGLVPEQVTLVLYVLLAAGEIDLTKGKQSIRDLYETLPSPIHYDRVVPGTGLGLEELRELQLLCDDLSVRTPKQWTVLSERQAIRSLAQAGKRDRDRWQPFILRLTAAGEAPELAARLRRHLGHWNALEAGEDVFVEFRQFLYEIGSATPFLQERRDLSGLPERIDRLLRDRDRLRHLLTHPKLRTALAAMGDSVAEDLGEVPGLERPEEVETWNRRAADAYESWKVLYRGAHDAYWAKTRSRVLAQAASFPALAKSRHLDLAEKIQEYHRLRAEAQQALCTGLSSLEFDPCCRCGFDGTDHLVRTVLDRRDALAEQIRETIARFFAQDEVRQRLAAWKKEGLETTPALLDYLAGKAAVPDLTKIDDFDRHLAGVAVVGVIESAELLRAVAGRTAEPRELVQTFARLLESRATTRVRIDIPTPAAPPEELHRWCLETSLATGVPLPPTLGTAAQRAALPGLRPGVVADAALAKIEELGLADEVQDQLIVWILDAKLALPGKDSLPPLLAAARELVRPSVPATVQDLAQEAALLYAMHERMVRLRPSEWLARLDAVAETEPTPRPPPLEEKLAVHADAQWLLLDAFGLALLGPLATDLLELVGRPRIRTEEFALAPEQSTTDGCYAALAAARLNHAFVKIDAVDQLLHEERMPFDDLVRRARAELSIAKKRVQRELDPARPLLLFADHGFRLAKDARSWRHGGSSPLERIVPLLRFDPRGDAESSRPRRRRSETD